MELNVMETLKGIVIVAGFTALGYFIVPIVFPDVTYMAWFFIVVMTASNFFAIMFSWYYFSKSRCYSDEGNIVTMYAYKIFGGSATHFVILILRLSGNVITAVMFLLAPGLLLIEFSPLFYMKIYLLVISFSTGLYFFEMINNIIVVSKGVDFKCKERSLLCDKFKDPIFCDF